MANTSKTPAPSQPAAALGLNQVVLTALRKHNGSIRFDADSKANDPIITSTYVEKFGIAEAFTRPAPGQIPGKIKLTVEVVEWVDGTTVPTADEYRERQEAKKKQKQNA